MKPFEYQLNKADLCQFCKCRRGKYSTQESRYHNQYVSVQHTSEGFVCVLRPKPPAEDLDMFDEPCTEWNALVCPIAMKVVK